MWNAIRHQLLRASGLAAGLVALMMVVPGFTLGRAIVWFILIALFDRLWGIHLAGPGRAARRAVAIGVITLFGVWELGSLYLASHPMTRKESHGIAQVFDASGAQLIADLFDPVGRTARAHRTEWARDANASRLMTDAVADQGATKLLLKTRNDKRWQHAWWVGQGKGDSTQAKQLAGEIASLDREIEALATGSVECDKGLAPLDWHGAWYEKVAIILIALVLLVFVPVMLAKIPHAGPVLAIVGFLIALACVFKGGALFNDPATCGANTAGAMAAVAPHDCTGTASAYNGCIAGSGVGEQCRTDAACCTSARNAWLTCAITR